MIFIEWFKDKNKLIIENSKMRKGKKDVEKKYEEALEHLEVVLENNKHGHSDGLTEEEVTVLLQSTIQNARNALANITLKYVGLLEQKSEAFDLYIKYEHQCAELTTERRELRKELAEKSEQNSALELENSQLKSKLDKAKKKIASKNEKSA